jgi:hypothetical protein
MGLLDGLKTGLMVQDYLDNNAQRQQESKLKAQLYDSQAKHYDAQNQLLNLQVQKQQAFQTGLAGDLQAFLGGGGTGTMTGPTPAEQAPGFIGPPVAPTLPRPRPVAPGGGEAQGDPQDKMLDFMSARALSRGMVEDYGKLQQAKIERQKVVSTQREEGIYNQLKFLQDIEANSPDPIHRQQAQNAQIALLLQVGKPGDALKLLERMRGAPTVTPAGATITTTPEMGPTQEHYQSPSRPIAVGPEQQLYQPATPSAGGIRPAVPITPKGKTTREIAADRRRGQQDADLELVEGTPAEVAQVEQQLLQGGATPEEAKRMAPIVLRGMAPAPEAPTAPAGETRAQRLARLKKEADLGAEGLEPSNPTRPVTGQRAAAGTSGTAEAKRGMTLAEVGSEGKGWVDRTTGEEIPEGETFGTVIDASKQRKTVRLEDPAERTQVRNMQQAIPILDQIDTLLRKIYDPKTGAYKNIQRSGRLAGGVENLYTRFAQSDPDLEEAARLVDGLAERFYRTYTGAVGVQTEKDVERAKQLLAKIGGLQPDTPAVAHRTMEGIYRTSEAIMRALLRNPDFSIEALRGTPKPPGSLLPPYGTAAPKARTGQPAPPAPAPAPQSSTPTAGDPVEQRLRDEGLIQ